MLELAGRADDGALAVALDRSRIAAERRDQRVRHVEAERLQVVHEAGDVLDIAPGERDSGSRRGSRRGAGVCDGPPSWKISSTSVTACGSRPTGMARLSSLRAVTAGGLAGVSIACLVCGGASTSAGLARQTRSAAAAIRPRPPQSSAHRCRRSAARRSISSCGQRPDGDGDAAARRDRCRA